MAANLLRLILPSFPASHLPVAFLPSCASNFGFYNLVGVEQMFVLA